MRGACLFAFGMACVSACRAAADVEVPPARTPPRLPAPASVVDDPSVRASDETKPEAFEAEGTLPEVEGRERLELDWPEEPFEVDLDGDGKTESVSWSCDPRPAVRVGRARYAEDRGYADLMGCTATVVDFSSTGSGRLLLLIGDEHEEAGPDRHTLLRLVDGELLVVWVDDGSTDFFTDGSWETSRGVCDDVDLVYRTTLSTHRLVDGEVRSTEEVSEEKIEPEDCAEP